MWLFKELLSQLAPLPYVVIVKVVDKCFSFILVQIKQDKSNQNYSQNAHYCIFYRKINHYYKYINVGTISIFIPILLYFGCLTTSSIIGILCYKSLYRTIILFGF